MLATASLAAAILASAGCSKARRGAGGGPSRRIGVALERGADGRRSGLSELAYAELERQVRDRGGRLVDADEGGPAAGRATGLDVLCLSSKLAGRDGEQLLRVLAEEDRDLVVAIGPGFSASLAKVAPEFPRVRFALIGAVDGSEPAAPDAGARASPNASSFSFDGGQGAFLLGALAGYMVAGEDRPRLGFIGGADTPAAHGYQAGFHAGAAYAAPALRKSGSLLAQYCGRYEAAFDDPEVARAIALYELKKGARILFLAAGASGRGAAQAALEAGALAMSASQDALGGSVVAATSPKADVAMSLVVGELFSSGSVGAGARRLGMKDGALGYVIDEARREDLAAFLPLVEKLRDRIASGEIEVPTDDEGAARFIKGLK